jgi:ankyrin repeat protein
MLVLLGVLTGCGGRDATVEGAGDEVLSPLFAAIDAGDLDGVQQELSANPALLNERQGKRYETPLHRAVLKEEIEVARFLLENGAHPNVTDVFGQTPLDVAIDIEASDELQDLIRQHGGED